MQNDDRERTEPEQPEQADTEPAETGPTEPGPADRERVPWPAEEPAGAAEVDAESADEFETWPREDAPAAAMPPPAADADSTQTFVSDDGAEPGEDAGSREDAGPGEDAGPDAGPPPREVEAYPASAAEPEPAAAATAAHSVPATEVGESTLCPRCGTENRPGIAFCRNCGQRLVAAGVATTVQRPSAPEGTQQCPRCGTHNRAGVAFCQNCGANLRATPSPATVPPSGYVPPTAGQVSGVPPQAKAPVRGGAVLGPVVLLVGAIGLATAWLLPFGYGGGSLWERSFGAPGGYGVAFWDSLAAAGGVLDQAYLALAAMAPILVALLVVLAIAGFLRAAPGALQGIGLVVALLWAIGLAVGFALIEVAGGWNGDLVGLLRDMSPAGIIAFLASLIVLIGGLTRLARS